MEPCDVASNAIRIAILDDNQNIALDYADWSQLPRLKLIASTGPGNASIDERAAAEHHITVTHTGYRATPTIELTWALIQAAARDLLGQATSLRTGGWQTSIGREPSGSGLGVLGLGRIGGEIARIGAAFGMDVIAWSQNLTPERARAAGAQWVSKRELFARSDFLTIHLVLSDRTRGLVTAADLAALVATPHIGYVAEDLYRTFYRDVVANIEAWLETARRSHGGAA
jgi:phosphoglycerate dehydrogenase-like enzyme